MIQTRFDDSKDLLKLIGAGAKVGIVACSDCAAAFKTSDTKRVNQICERFSGRNEILFRLSVSSPCDGRVFARLAKTAPRFGEAECYIVLACEAGLRTVSAYIGEAKASSGADFKIVSPVITMSYAMIDADNQPYNACIFCGECRFEGRIGPCPVANCPAHKKEGPCQDRADDFCAHGAERRKCSWL
jgi:hypothetical protein